jgi:hypothetical protein
LRSRRMATRMSPDAFAPRTAGRARLVPPPAPIADHPAPHPPPPPGANRIPWADLLRRVFALDVLRCSVRARA